MSISQLFPWNLHCMFYYFFSAPCNMNKEVIFTIALLSWIRNEDLEKSNTLAHPQAVANRAKGWNWEMKAEELNQSHSYCRLVAWLRNSSSFLVSSESFISRTNQPNHLVSFPEPVSLLAKWDTVYSRSVSLPQSK